MKALQRPVMLPAGRHCFTRLVSYCASPDTEDECTSWRMANALKSDQHQRGVEDRRRVLQVAVLKL